MRRVHLLLLLFTGLLSAQGPLLIHLGPATLHPYGFLDAIGMSRTPPTADNVSTNFARIPLTPGPWESLASIRHSRLNMRADAPAGPLQFSVYLESDFMNFTPAEGDYRWRQYWGAVRAGKWELLGGKAWSLLRPNRTGTASDQGTMNTDVIEPAYHVGLLGSRVRQVRLTRDFKRYNAALAWEGDGNFATKIVRDGERSHLEAAAIAGRFGRRGITASSVISPVSHLRIVQQQYWSKRAAYEAMSVVPAGVNGLSTLEGVETDARKGLELYAYGGLVYAARRDPNGNRLVRQWSVGCNQRISIPALRSGVLLSLQYSHLDRAIWQGREGVMDYVMYRVRYIFN